MRISRRKTTPVSEETIREMDNEASGLEPKSSAGEDQALLKQYQEEKIEIQDLIHRGRGLNKRSEVLKILEGRRLLRRAQIMLADWDEDGVRS